MTLLENCKGSDLKPQINKFNQWYCIFSHRSFDDDDSVISEPNETVFPKF